jgi:hypothetical protein
MEFLKKHYEKIILCVVLLGLAAAAVLMRMAIDKVQENLPAPPASPTTERRGRGKAAAEGGKSSSPVLDLSTNEKALALATNPPIFTLSGEHNLFNPVTWKRKSDGTLIKVIKQGPDALTVTNITPLYTVIAYDHASGGGSGVYVMGTATQSDLQHPKRLVTEFAKKNEKVKSGLYIIRDVKGDADNPTEIDVELTATGGIAQITKEKPLEQEDSCIADLRYEPDAKTFYKVHVNDPLRLDGEQYKVVEITNNAVRIQFNRTTKVTEINWTK